MPSELPWARSADCPKLRCLQVLEPGPLTTVQDLGRPGFAHLGIPRSGAADPVSLKLANRLVGNAESAAGLETTLRGPRLQLPAGCTFALTGAEVDASLDGASVAMNSPVHLSSEAVLTVGTASTGLRTYIALRGGIVCQQAFASRSTDLRSGLGPPALTRGDHLPLGPARGPFPAVDLAPIAPPASEPSLLLLPGPREHLFPSEALATLLAEWFTVSSDINRIGVRLTGPPLPCSSVELLSEPVVSGSLQVPPDGLPIILMADHPTTGGYPVIAVVHSEDLHRVGQLRPGQRLRFRVPTVAGKGL